MRIIIQARLSSKRLRGKVLKKIKNKPVLAYLIDIITNLENKCDITIATSNRKSDDKIENFCKRIGISCYRGKLNKVSDRFYEITKNYNSKYFMRLCADSPLITKSEIDKFINLSKKSNADLITNRYCNYPKGHTIEIIKTSVFKNIKKLLKTKEDFEHVTNFYYRKPKDFKINYVKSNRPMQDINLAVDTLEDLKRIKKIVSKMSKNAYEYELQDIIKIYKSLEFK